MLDGTSFRTNPNGARAASTGGRRSEASRFAKSIRAIGALPTEAGAATSEMAISGGVLINRDGEDRAPR